MRADRAFATLALAGLLAGCSASAGESASVADHVREQEHGSIRLDLASGKTASASMPGKIDPADGRWQTSGSRALYGQPGKPALLELACTGDTISVSRNIASQEDAKAMLAFVGYRGILRLPVSNDGEAWHGTLPARDPRWIAVTGGPFYATVAGGGKVIVPAMGATAGIIASCGGTNAPA